MAVKFIQRFKTVFHYIKDTEADVKINPFGSFRFRMTKVVREILSQEEIDIIYKKVFLTERLTQVRDIFIFACFSNLEDKRQRKENHGNVLIVKNERPLVALSV